MAKSEYWIVKTLLKCTFLTHWAPEIVTTWWRGLVCHPHKCHPYLPLLLQLYCQHHFQLLCQLESQACHPDKCHLYLPLWVGSDVGSWVGVTVGKGVIVGTCVGNRLGLQLAQQLEVMLKWVMHSRLCFPEEIVAFSKLQEIRVCVASYVSLTVFAGALYGRGSGNVTLR